MSLTEWVNAHLEDSDLPDEVALLVLAALEGDNELDGYLDDGVAVARPEPSAASDEVEANGVVLTSIKVEGFRGIGATCELPIAPKPGLTIVAGRNGSGKSSFSEALELVLTGGTYRWANKSAEWREQWRNLHHPSAAVSVGLVEEGVGPITVTSTWSDDESSVESRTVKAQVAGQPQVHTIEHLGWKRALEQFRPILSYDELGGMLEGKQSELYDALASILGVEQLGDAVKRLKARSDARKGPGAAATARRKELLGQAAASTDDRAAEAATSLRKADPDTARLRALATGGEQVDRGPLPALRALSTLSTPDETAVLVAVTRLRAAKNELADAGAQVSQRNRDRLKLLEQGLLLHASHGDQTCPVCRAGNLDAAWAETSKALVEHEKKQFAEVEAAHQTFDLAFEAVRKLLQSPPPQLTNAPMPSLQVTVDEARQAWSAWTNIEVKKDAGGADVLAAHVEKQLPALAAAISCLRESAASEVSALDDEWRPLASAIAGWCDDWEAWKNVEPSVKQLLHAEKWLKDNDLRLKNERLEPIQAQARHAWEKLKQESNVELGALELTGTNTRRRVRISGAIDGEAVDSFAVFSQGELHALTLSLFLPRATLAQSPFRFVVLDDPVQAMDPAKVDGLVDLLGELAQARQVIVFSHDDRLPAALRRSPHDATILEVSRGANSAVSITASQDPTVRYLRDAHGLIKEWQHDRLTEDDLRKTLPGLYRFAIESAAKDRYFANRLATGASIHDLESTWSGTYNTRKRVLLAIFGEEPQEHLAQRWISGPYRPGALGIASNGFHRGLATDPEDAHYKTKKLVEDIKAGAR
ncbi:AAA family ATPase [Ornithinimicrobium sp. W1679]|uniref:AAA family ATPase n=1 Tax=Ornithinimicrobium sp. W1679 TaxID=3418770 RepID=UPI003CEB12E1